MAEEKQILEFGKPSMEVSRTAEEEAGLPEFLTQEVCVFDLLAQQLKSLGISTVYSMSAGGIWPHETTMMKAGIARVNVHHEQTATFAADAEARLRGRPGMALIGPATGLTNAAAGICQAYSAQAPMFVLVGESGTYDDDIPMLQGVARAENQYRGITKWTRRVVNPSVLLMQVMRGFRSCVTPPYGPVCVATPYEFLESAVHRGPMIRYLNMYNPDPLVWPPKLEMGRSTAPAAEIEAAMKWFMEAEKPAMIVG